jgi:hypothetical protein
MNLIMKKAIERVKGFLKGEEGYTTETLVWGSVMGVGAATVAFGLYAAARFQGGGIGDDLKAVATPSALPKGTEQVTNLQAGYTGAITGITIQ